MSSLKRAIGDTGESIARNYLLDNNYKILENNYCKPWGEIDIIAKNNKGLVFVEVKSRIITKTNHLPPETNVHFTKQQKIIKTAQSYLAEKNYPENISWQIDVIAIELNTKTRKANLKHIKNAVWQQNQYELF